jgi:hypothetical protein
MKHHQLSPQLEKWCKPGTNGEQTLEERFLVVEQLPPSANLSDTWACTSNLLHPAEVLAGRRIRGSAVNNGSVGDVRGGQEIAHLLQVRRLRAVE